MVAATVHYNSYKRPQEEEDTIELKRKGDMPPLLWEMLRRATPRGYEHHIINVLPFKNQGVIDQMGNFSIVVGKNPTTMFSCHMDTMHHLDEKKFPPTGKCPSIRLVVKDPSKCKDTDKGYVWGANANVDRNRAGLWVPETLGADDKAGCYILSEMIAHNIPGLYVFHVGEEGGCIGSHWIAKEKPEFVKGIQRCIAFDRKDYTDVIAFQRGSRSASTKFTNAIAASLNELMKLPEDKYRFRGEVHGMVTDSASYVDLIPECTNISIGYFENHGSHEKLDYYWLSKMLLPAVLNVKWNDLPVDRKAGEKTSMGYNRNYRYENTGEYDLDWYDYTGVMNQGSSNSAGHVIGDAPVAPHLVSVATARNRIPAWTPDQKLIPTASKDGMKEIIRKWYSNTAVTGPVISEVIFQMLLENSMLSTQLKSAHAKMTALENEFKAITAVKQIMEEQPKKDNVISLPPPKKDEEQKQLSIETLAFDKDGYPLSSDLRTYRITQKAALLKELLVAVAGLQFNNRHKQALNAITEKTPALVAWADASPMNKKLYRVLNETLSDLYNIVEAGPMCSVPSEKLTELYIKASQHLKECYLEPGVRIRNVAAA